MRSAGILFEGQSNKPREQDTSELHFDEKSEGLSVGEGMKYLRTN
jgi:hypothetical protein